MNVLDKNNLKNLSESPFITVFDAGEAERKKLLDAGIFGENKVKFFNFVSKISENNKESIEQSSINSSDDVAQNAGEVAILSGRSLRNLLVKYPYRAKYVLFRVSFLNLSFYLGLIGLLRRYILGRRYVNGRIKFHSFLKPSSNRPYSYVILENRNSTVTTHYSISASMGYKGLLDYLNSIDASYVVLRFFDKLPQGGRVGGDLDMLVSDEVYKVAAQFLNANPGSEMVDMYSVTGPANASRIPYYTPYLARKLLVETETKNGYKVPTTENYLHSLIYHCLYHKGLSSGIPTCYQSLSVSSSPDNDYLAVITGLADQVGVSCGKTLEELDGYMKTTGWRPHLDTLELLATTNKWLSRHIESEKLEPEIAVLACVLKRGFFDHNNIDEFRQSLKELEFEVLVDEFLVDDRLQIASDHLRGGNWSSTNDNSYYPGHIFILYDASAYGRYVRKFDLPYNPRSKKLKLRSVYDVDHESHIHMTDSTHQTIEYIDVLYSGRFPEFRKKIESEDGSKRSNKLYGFYYWLNSLSLSVKASVKSTVSKVIRKIV